MLGKCKQLLLDNRWLLLRRISQIGILALFLAGPWFGIWILKGNLAASEIIGRVPLADPFILLQSLFAGHRPERSFVVGGLIIAVTYALIGGRIYCGWVCPINVVTDAAAWMRRRLGIRQNLKLDPSTRYWLIGVMLVLSFFTATIAWEVVNPITMLQRGLVFGLGLVPVVVTVIFLFDLLLMKHGWCGKLCPVGAFYGLLGSRGLIGVAARKRDACTRCGDCFEVCPEPQVIAQPLYGVAQGTPATEVKDLITNRDCLNCGRCIDVCQEQVFRFVIQRR